MLANTGASPHASVAVGWWEWAAFLAVLAVMLLVDMLVLHKEAHVPTPKRALIESVSWISIGLAFGLVMWLQFGGAAAGEYYAGYLIEKSLSIDNVFVWALILRYFAVPRQFQHRVLFWGIFAALVLRAGFIFGGVALLNSFDWILYLFGAFLLYTAVKLLTSNEDDMDPGKSKAMQLAKRLVASTDEFDGQHMFTRVNGRRLATPLFFVLIVIEVSDVLFAVDSVPAILAVTRTQFIVFSSNALAILGLRSLYFLLADLHDRFRYLQQGLAVILAFVGVKMLLAEGLPDGLQGEWTPHWLTGLHIPIGLSLGIIGAVLAAAIGFSMVGSAPPTDHSGPPPTIT